MRGPRGQEATGRDRNGRDPNNRERIDRNGTAQGLRAPAGSGLWATIAAPREGNRAGVRTAHRQPDRKPHLKAPPRPGRVAPRPSGLPGNQGGSRSSALAVAAGLRTPAGPRLAANLHPAASLRMAATGRPRRPAPVAEAGGRGRLAAEIGPADEAERGIESAAEVRFAMPRKGFRPGADPNLAKTDSGQELGRCNSSGKCWSKSEIEASPRDFSASTSQGVGISPISS